MFQTRTEGAISCNNQYSFSKLLTNYRKSFQKSGQILLNNKSPNKQQQPSVAEFQALSPRGRRISIVQHFEKKWGLEDAFVKLIGSTEGLAA